MTVMVVSKNNSIFIGQEVALFVKKHFEKELVKLTTYKNGKYREALEEIFYKMDEMMLTPAGQKEIQSIQK